MGLNVLGDEIFALVSLNKVGSIVLGELKQSLGGLDMVNQQFFDCWIDVLEGAFEYHLEDAVKRAEEAVTVRQFGILIQLQDPNLVGYVVLVLLDQPQL